jgi:hypothetical protein
MRTYIHTITHLRNSQGCCTRGCREDLSDKKTQCDQGRRRKTTREEVGNDHGVGWVEDHYQCLVKYVWVYVYTYIQLCGPCIDTREEIGNDHSVSRVKDRYQCLVKSVWGVCVSLMWPVSKILASNPVQISNCGHLRDIRCLKTYQTRKWRCYHIVYTYAYTYIHTRRWYMT